MSSVVDIVLYAVLLLVNIAGIPVESALEFTEVPGTKVYAIKGSNATLRWDYSVDNKTKEFGAILWSVDDRASSSLKHLIIEREDGSRDFHNDLPQGYSGRVHIEGRASLVIENVTAMDSTNFKCTLRGKGVVVGDENTVALIVTDPAEITPGLRTVQVGKDASFTCNATGTPAKNFTWVKGITEGKRVIISDGHYEIVSTDGTSQLTIKNATKEDLGHYQCNATTAQRNVDTAFLGVIFLSAPKVSGLVSTVKATRGDLVVLECPVSGFPPPEVTWILPNGYVLPGRLHFTLSVNVKNDTDFGNHTCHATSGEKTVGPFIIHLQNRVSQHNSTDEGGALVSWQAVDFADYYLVEITGDEIEDDVLIAKDKTFVWIHFHTLVLKPAAKNLKEVVISVEVTAVNKQVGFISKSHLSLVVSAAVTLRASVVHLFVFLVLMLNR